MANKLISNKKLVEIIEQEGLGYTFTCYLDFQEIKDKKVRKLAKVLATTYEKIEEILYNEE